jgi:hypothetical protein
MSMRVHHARSHAIARRRGSSYALAAVGEPRHSRLDENATYEWCAFHWKQATSYCDFSL